MTHISSAREAARRASNIRFGSVAVPSNGRVEVTRIGVGGRREDVVVTSDAPATGITTTSQQVTSDIVEQAKEQQAFAQAPAPPQVLQPTRVPVGDVSTIFERRVLPSGRVTREFIAGQEVPVGEIRARRRRGELRVGDERQPLERLQSRLETQIARQAPGPGRAAKIFGVFGIGAGLGLFRTVILGPIQAVTRPRETIAGVTAFLRDPLTPVGRIGPALAARPAATAGEIVGSIGGAFVPGAIIGRVARARAAAITPEAVGVKVATTRIITTGEVGAITQEAAKVTGRIVGPGLIRRRRVTRIAGVAEELGVPVRPPVGPSFVRLRGRQELVARLERGAEFTAERITEGISREIGQQQVATTRLAAAVVRRPGAQRGVGITTIESLITRPTRQPNVFATIGTVRQITRPRPTVEPIPLTRETLARALARPERPILQITGRARRLRREFLFETPAGITEAEFFKGVSFAVRPAPFARLRRRRVRFRRPRPLPPVREDLAEIISGAAPPTVRFPKRQVTTFQQVQPRPITRLRRRRRPTLTGLEESVQLGTVDLGRLAFAEGLAQEVAAVSRVGTIAGLGVTTASRLAVAQQARLAAAQQLRQITRPEQIVRPTTITPTAVTPAQVLRPITVAVPAVRVVPVTRIRQAVLPRIRAAVVSPPTPVPTPTVAIPFTIIAPPAPLPIQQAFVEPIIRRRRRRDGVAEVAFTPGFTALGLGIIGIPEKLTGFTGFELRKIVPRRLRPRFTV